MGNIFYFLIFIVLAKLAKEEEEVSYDISSFINRAPPQMKRPLTVGGLDKKSAESCWKAIKNPIQDGKKYLKRLTCFR
jgi:hypothetical protein